jgi:hypothetical protein
MKSLSILICFISAFITQAFCQEPISLNGEWISEGQMQGQNYKFLVSYSANETATYHIKASSGESLKGIFNYTLSGNTLTTTFEGEPPEVEFITSFTSQSYTSVDSIDQNDVSTYLKINRSIALTIIFFSSILALVVGALLIIAHSFRTSIVWGVLVLFISILQWVHVIRNWKSTKTYFLVQIAGLVAMAISGMYMENTSTYAYFLPVIK